MLAVPEEFVATVPMMNPVVLSLKDITSPPIAVDRVAVSATVSPIAALVGLTVNELIWVVEGSEVPVSAVPIFMQTEAPALVTQVPVVVSVKTAVL